VKLGSEKSKPITAEINTIFLCLYTAQY